MRRREKEEPSLCTVCAGVVSRRDDVRKHQRIGSTRLRRRGGKEDDEEEDRDQREKERKKARKRREAREVGR